VCLEEDTELAWYSGCYRLSVICVYPTVVSWYDGICRYGGVTV
jgi:hypothetical protein